MVFKNNNNIRGRFIEFKNNNHIKERVIVFKNNYIRECVI